MLFHEPLFLFVFLPSFGLLYAALRQSRPARFWLLLGSSLLFYLWAEPVFVPLVLASAALDHLLALGIARDTARRPRRAGWLLAAGVAQNLLILFHYKYQHWLGGMLGLPEGAGGWFAAVALPVGVSFVVFEKITYLVDVRRGASAPAPGLAPYLLYVLFFPKLLAGPIIKYHDLDGQLRALPPAGLDDLSRGFQRFMQGVIKKVLLADVLAGGADAAFAAGAGPDGALGFAGAWLGALFFTFQIYLDFSGYSDMAIGLAGMAGFRLAENFAQPYLARSMTDFWRRWHISLTSWIREYLYIPLGGSRGGAARTYANLWLCFLASGLWHGAAWTFVAWGAWNGLFLVLDRLFLARALARLPFVLANGATMLVVVCGWVVFRAPSLQQAGAMLSAMAQPGRPGAGPPVTSDLWLALAASVAVCWLPWVAGLARRLPAAAGWDSRVRTWRRAGWLAAAAPRAAASWGLLLLFVAALGKTLADPFSPFIYFRF